MAIRKAVVSKTKALVRFVRKRKAAGMSKKAIAVEMRKKIKDGSIYIGKPAKAVLSTTKKFLKSKAGAAAMGAAAGTGASSVHNKRKKKKKK